MTKEAEVLKYVNGKIADLEDDLQHYTMVDKDKCREFYIREDLKQFTNIQQALLELQVIKEAKPSEALISLRGFKYGMITDNAICITKSYFDDKFPIIENALQKAQAQAQELARYNKLEEELGCPLEVVFKAVLRWIYYEDTSGNITRDYVDLHTTLDGEYVLLCNNSEKVFFTKDYKKTFWLRKDKSE